MPYWLCQLLFRPINTDGSPGEITDTKVFDPEKVYHKK